MPAPTATAQLDGIFLVRKGMHSGVQPRLVAQDQTAFAINVTFRGGFPRTRPVLRKVPLVYADGTTQTRATQALFQVAHGYQVFGVGENCLVSMIGGRLFRYLVGSTNMVQEITPGTSHSDINDPTLEDGWMWQSEDFLITNNGQALPYFFDGAGVRRSQGGNKELPPGCMGAYVQGRNWMALPGRRSFMGGDLVYSHGFPNPYQGREAVLQTTENTLLAGGGAFGVPVQAGQINAMTSVAIADTSLGQGALQVLTQNSVFSVNTPIDRAQWVNTQFPLMVIGLPNYGSVSQTGVSTVNGDLWYRSADGVRGYQIARRDFNTWVNTPESVEVESILNLDTQNLLGRASSVLFNNRFLVTCSPYEVADRGTAHRGAIALDFNNISTLTSRSDPCYDGLWTGIPILQLVKGVFNQVERCFAFALDKNGDICLYELLMDGQGYFDWDGTQSVGVESALETRSLSWNAKGNAMYKLLCGDLYLDRLAGNNNVDWKFWFRSDEDPVWQEWHNFSLCAPVKDCSTDGCPTFQNVREQYRTFIRLPDPQDTCSQITKRSLRTGYEFQIRGWWKGFAQWNRFHVWADPKLDSVVKSCPTSENCVLLTGCDLPWFDYRVEPGGDTPPGPPGPPVPPPPSPPANPEWPVPTPYTCAGRNLWGPILVVDSQTGGDAFVGIAPGAMSPIDYLNMFGAPGCLDAWSAEVWAQFIASGTSYSQARLIWYDMHTTGKGWFAQQVFPGQPGGYGPGTIDLDSKIVVE